MNRRPGAPDLERAARAIEEFLDALGAPVGSDPELATTGRRVAEAFANDLLSGYALRPEEILREATASSATGSVIVADLPATAVCPHHLLPASGVVHVAYLPGGKVIGLGAIGRLVDALSRRLVLQEDLAAQIARALVEHAGARGAAAIVDLEPTCTIARGERRHGSRAIAQGLAGIYATDGGARAELFSSLALAVRGAKNESPGRRARASDHVEAARPSSPSQQTVRRPTGGE